MLAQRLLKVFKKTIDVYEMKHSLMFIDFKKVFVSFRFCWYEIFCWSRPGLCVKCFKRFPKILD